MPDLPPHSSSTYSEMSNDPLTNDSMGREVKNSTLRNILNPRYLWHHNRWLFVAYASVATIVLLGFVLFAIQLLLQASSSKSDDVTSQQKLDTDHKSISTHNSEDDSFFAAQPLTILYYSFAQTTNSKHVYQATPTDKENRIINVGYPDKYNFSTSPHGSWFIRWNETTVERSSAQNPQKFTPIYTVSEKDFIINSVVWQSDETSIAIALSNNINSESEAKRNLVLILPLATLQAVNVYDSTHDFNVELISFPNTNSIYFIENNNGLKRNLALFNIQSRRVVTQFSEFNQNNLLSKLQFSSDMKWAIYHTDTQVIRYNLDSMEQSTVYNTDRHCEVGSPNNSTNDWTTFSPSGSTILVHERLSPCAHRGRRSQSTSDLHSSQTTLFSLDEDKVLQRVYDREVSGLLSSLWSPGEDKVWLSFDTQQAYIASTSDLRFHPIPTVQRQALTLERVFPIGWLQGKK